MASAEEVQTRPSEHAGQMRVAVLAAVAALLGAAIGAVAGVGGAVYQANSQRDLAVRQEREAAYAQMNLAFNRFSTAAPDEKCARVDDLDEPYSLVLLLGSNVASSNAWFAMQSAEKICASVKAGKTPAAEEYGGFTTSAATFIAAAQKDLAR